jgi:hypothetical protein
VDPEYSAAVEKVACEIAGPSASEAVMRLTRTAAEAQLDVIRCRQARCRLGEVTPDDERTVPRLRRSLAKELTAIDRYERRALLRRNRALQDIDCQRLIESVTS